MVAATAVAVGCTAIAIVSGVRVHKVPLRRSDPGSPWCYAATAFTLDDDGTDHAGGRQTSTGVMVNPNPNFLATQVWPSARAAATVLEHHVDPSWTVCELGCGPALPSLAATAGAARVVATDLDPFALRLARAAADEQGLTNLSTMEFDLTSVGGDESLPDADLYVMSDVFESAAVARGAAEHTVRALDSGRRVWVFAQSDRAQRESYRRCLVELLPRRDVDLEWSTRVDMESKLWLYDVDETKVVYC